MVRGEDSEEGGPEAGRPVSAESQQQQNEFGEARYEQLHLMDLDLGGDDRQRSMLQYVTPRCVGRLACCLLLASASVVLAMHGIVRSDAFACESISVSLLSLFLPGVSLPPSLPTSPSSPALSLSLETIVLQWKAFFKHSHA